MFHIFATFKRELVLMRKTLLIAAFVSLLLVGCGGTQIYKGTFEAMLPDSYTGPTMRMEKDSNAWKANISIRNYKKEILELWGMKNETVDGFDYTLKPTEAELYYDLKTFPITGSIDYFINKNEWIAGFGSGLSPYPYLRLTGGLNKEFFEFGLFASLGYAKVSYSAYGTYIHDTMNIAGAGYSTKGDIECDDCSEWKFNGNAGLYVNYFGWNGVTLSYSLSAFCPWLYNELQGSPLTFDFPYIFTHYLGMSYMFTEHIQASLGIDAHWGNAFNGIILNMDSKISFVF